MKMAEVAKFLESREWKRCQCGRWADPKSLGHYFLDEAYRVEWAEEQKLATRRTK